MRSKLKAFIIGTLTVLLITLTIMVQANFDKLIISKTIVVSIGSWEEGIDFPYTDFIIDNWIEEDTLNQIIPKDQLFMYEGHLYISLGNYNPYYNGLPLEYSIPWAFVATELEWIPNTNYRANSVVIRDGRYFIANPNYNTEAWFVNDPLIYNGGQWSEWREIEPIDENHFELFDGLSIRDYTKPSWDYIIYK